MSSLCCQAWVQFSCILRTLDSDMFFKNPTDHSHTIGLNIYLDIGTALTDHKCDRAGQVIWTRILYDTAWVTGEDCTSCFKGQWITLYF